MASLLSYIEHLFCYHNSWPLVIAELQNIFFQFLDDPGFSYLMSQAGGSKYMQLRRGHHTLMVKFAPVVGEQNR